MRIVDLLKKDSIMLCGSPKSKSEAIDRTDLCIRSQTEHTKRRKRLQKSIRSKKYTIRSTRWGLS